MTYHEAKEAKRIAEKERRRRRDAFEMIRRAAATGDEGAKAIWNKLTAGRRANSSAMIAGTAYSVDENGTYRRVES